MMDGPTYDRLSGLFRAGKLKKLSLELAPFLEKGDHDAQFLNAHFSIDPKESGSALDVRTIKILTYLADHFHARSLYALAWRFRHGDDVEVDANRFKSYLAASALLGMREAIEDLAKVLESDLGWVGFSEHLSKGS